jgi:hypothetical protein
MINFVDFPYDFDAKDNLFLEALKSSKFFNKNGMHADITFLGCYPKMSFSKKLILFVKSRLTNDGMSEWLNHQKGLSNIKRTSGRKIWITFENRRIPPHGVDLTLSFDSDPNNGKNLYFPLIYSYIDFLGTGSSYVRHPIEFEQLQLRRQNIGKPISDRKFACTFINNPDPVRLRFIKELSRYGEIDVFGRYSNNYIADKITKGNEYRFVICFENDLFPGYVTEKPLEAWLSKSVPVYWGDDSAEILNSESLINCASYQSLSEAAQFVASLSKEPKLVEEIVKQPLLNTSVVKPDIVTFLDQIFNDLPLR